MGVPFHVYAFNSLIGGLDGDLDNIDHTDADGRGTPLQVDDFAVGSDDSDNFTVYQVRDTGAAEDPPDIIAPDSGSTLRWYRLDMVDAVFAAHIASTSDPHGSVDDTAYDEGTWDAVTNIAPSKNAVRDKFVTNDAAIALNTTHRGSTGADHSDVVSNTSDRHAESHTVASHNDTTATGTQLNTLVGGGDTTLHDHDGISENTTHRGSDGKNHADVVLNNTHRGSDGKNHADVVLNNTHRGQTDDPHGSVDDTAYDSGTWDAVINVAPSKNAVRDKITTMDSAISANTSHKDGDGSDHGDVATNTSLAHAASHTVASHNDTTATGTQLNTLVGGGDTTLHSHDGQYFTESEHIVTSAGAGDSGKPIKLDAAGHVDATMINDGDIDHVNIANKGSNTHATIDSHLSDTSNPHSITSTAAEWTAQQNFNEYALTSGTAVAWNMDLAQTALLTLGHNATISAPSNLNAGATYILRVVQAAGVYSLAWNAVFKWGAADTPAAPAASGDVCIFSFYSDGTNLYGVEAIREEA